jgi:hypothetical protein
MLTGRAAAKSAPMRGNPDHNLLTAEQSRGIARWVQRGFGLARVVACLPEVCSPIQRLEAMKPDSVEMPTRNRYVAADGASQRPRDDGADEALMRRRARGLALLLMILSAIVVIALAIGAWFLLRR